MTNSACALMLAMLLSAPRPAIQDGSFTTAGCGCPEVTSDSGPVLYGTLPAGAWTLDGAALTYTSTGTSWSVEVGGAYLEPSPAANLLAAGDDDVLGPLLLPFTFTYPGGAGTTSAIDVNTNGRVYLESGTNANSGGWSAGEILPDFLAATPSLCPLGVDLNPGAGGVISFETRTLGVASVALVTWELVPEYPDVGANTVQCQLWSTGQVVLCHVETNGSSAVRDALVGVSSGGGASDPGPSSLAVPLSLAIEGEPVIGNTFSIVVRGVPSSAVSGRLRLGYGFPPAPIPLPGAPAGCEQLIDSIFMDVPLVVAPPRATATLDWPFEEGDVGATFYGQAFVLDPDQGTSLPTVVSDRGILTLGAPPDLAFVIEGDNSYTGSPARGGFFRLESSEGATHPDIVRLEVTLDGGQRTFDVVGNAGVDGQGFFSDGSGGGGGGACANAFYGSDVQTGLVYGGGLQSAGCAGAGSSGWVGSDPVGPTSHRFRTLEFEFTDFAAGELFGFDCDTDGGDFNAGAHAATVTVTFADRTSITQQVQLVTNDRAEGVLIP